VGLHSWILQLRTTDRLTFTGPLERYLVEAVDVNGLQVSVTTRMSIKTKLTSRRFQLVSLRRPLPMIKEDSHLCTQSPGSGTPIDG
jgi:hypothetical protein